MGVQGTPGAWDALRTWGTLGMWGTVMYGVSGDMGHHGRWAIMSAQDTQRLGVSWRHGTCQNMGDARARSSMGTRAIPETWGILWDCGEPWGMGSPRDIGHHGRWATMGVQSTPGTWDTLGDMGHSGDMGYLGDMRRPGDVGHPWRHGTP